MRASRLTMPLAAAIMVASAIVAVVPAHVAACGATAPSFANAVLGAQAIARVTVTDVERSPDGARQYDLRVERQLKGEVPDRIVGWDPSAFPGTCDDGWYARPGGRAYLFLQVLQPWGGVQDLRLVPYPGYPMAEQMWGLDVSTQDAVDRAILAHAPSAGDAVPSMAFVADCYRGTDTQPDPNGGEPAVISLLLHTDGSLTVQAYITLLRSRVSRAVIRAGDLATPGPVLFRLPLQAEGGGYHHGVRAASDAFVPSAVADTAAEALQLIDQDGAVIELWVDPDARPEHPRVHGILSPVALTPLELEGRDLPDSLPPTDAAAPTKALPTGDRPPMAAALASVALVALVLSVAWLRRRPAAQSRTR